MPHRTNSSRVSSFLTTTLQCSIFQANQQHIHPRFQTHLRQPAIRQSPVTNPGVVAPVRHLGSPPRLHGPFHPAIAGINPPRSIIQPSIAPRSIIQPSIAPAPNSSLPLQQPSLMISARGMTVTQPQPHRPTTLPSPVTVPSPAIPSSPFKGPSWQVRSPQPTGLNLNQPPSFIVSTPPSVNRITPSTQQVFVSSPTVPQRGTPLPIQHLPVNFAYSPPVTNPPSPMQGFLQSSTSTSFNKVAGPIHQPLTSPSVPIMRGVQAPPSSVFSSPLLQMKHPQPTFRPPVLTSHPRPYTSSVSAVPRGMLPRPRGMSPVPRGMPSTEGVLHQGLQSSPLISSAWQARNPQSVPSFNPRLSFAAGFDRHLPEPHWSNAVPNIQHFIGRENSVPSHFGKRSIHSKNENQSSEMQQPIPSKKKNSEFSPDGRPLYRRTGSYRDGQRGREPGKRRLRYK